MIKQYFNEKALQFEKYIELINKLIEKYKNDVLNREILSIVKCSCFHLYDICIGHFDFKNKETLLFYLKEIRKTFDIEHTTINRIFLVYHRADYIDCASICKAVLDDLEKTLFELYNTIKTLEKGGKND